VTIRLRSHHLLCVLTFAGYGYSPDFVANFEQIVGRIAAGGEEIEVVEEPDDVCETLTSAPFCHCRNASVLRRDDCATAALGDLLRQSIRPGSRVRLSHDRLSVMREAFARGTIREACAGCQWTTVCDAIARDDFQGTRLLQFERRETASGSEPVCTEG